MPEAIGIKDFAATFMLPVNYVPLVPETNDVKLYAGK